MTTSPCESDALSVEFEEEPGDVLVAHIHGALDLSTAPALDRALSRYLEEVRARRVLLDLRDMEFLGCQGVTVLVRVARWAKVHTGCEPPCLVGLSSCGRRLLALVEVIDMFSVQDSVEGALTGE
ncbi:STAS domain-containing protein [Pseudonocardia adelaidensis]|uniref:STAS domain-containing protein n=1 Tax=Pseudonocardia adelaidensis TaxID=648754 RepID=A0ABP9NTQ1_9PSEU